MEQNKIVCWARSPGDHALNLEQFPILNFNETRPNFNKVILELIDFEKKQKLDSQSDDDSSDTKLDNLNNQVDGLTTDIDTFETLIGVKKYKISL